MDAYPEIITFGCRLNSYESEVMKGLVVQAGLEDVVIINTCAVTGEAERQARQTIRKIRRGKPKAKIIVTGCAAQIAPEKYASMEEVDYVIGNDLKMKLESYTALDEKKIHITDIQLVKDMALHLVQGFEGMTRAFVQVQNGCDHRCTFCIIPFGRGRSRSVPVEPIINQVRLLVERGNPEIALTGVDITAYGQDLPGRPTLGQMIRMLLDGVPALKRLRLSSLDVAEVDNDLWQIIENEPRLMPHLHLSVQSGDDTILKRMARRHRQKDVTNFCARVRASRPEMAFGADIIAGFPTETDEMFENTAHLLQDCDFTWLHVFPYSARVGTAAARMPQVRGEIRKARAAKLREIGVKAIHRHTNGLVGQEIDVHVEQPLLARTPTFAEVNLDMAAEVGSVIRVAGLNRDGERLAARIVRKK